MCISLIRQLGLKGLQSCWYLVRHCSTFLLNNFFWKSTKLKILFKKFVLVYWYSDTKIIFGKMREIFGFKKWLWKVKITNFWWFWPKLSYKISKNPLSGFIGMQNIYYGFHLTSLKFPNRHHAKKQSLAIRANFFGISFTNQPFERDLGRV